MNRAASSKRLLAVTSLVALAMAIPAVAGRSRLQDKKPDYPPFKTVIEDFTKVVSTMDGSARTLGLGPGATLVRVHIPIISGSLLTAALLVFVDVMKELPATLIMRPFNFNTLAVRAFELAEDEQLAESAPALLSIVGFGILPVILLTLAIARSRPGHWADR